MFFFRQPFVYRQDSNLFVAKPFGFCSLVSMSASISNSSCGAAIDKSQSVVVFDFMVAQRAPIHVNPHSFHRQPRDGFTDDVGNGENGHEIIFIVCFF